ncbi:MAG: 23S rRNA (guanosine(2251)-2'-O)-methyltransferase RlmB [Clostridia bacterium]|nr:23S rRNA (guanosine(2251)-2'-O)-methyltransferase RlmB [Clostridia bacterium]
MSELIVGRNAVLEALKAGREIEKINIQKLEKGANPSGSVKQIIAKAKDAKIPVYHSDKAFMDKMMDGAKVNYQGVIATASDYSYCEIEDILAFAREKDEKPFIVILDGLEDPHNLGAIMRTAECAGAHGIIIPKRRSVSVNETVLKTSAGAAEHMLCARVTNIGNAIDELKEEGVWIYACDMGDELMYDQDMTGSVGIVIGSEGFGISRLVREKCDFVVSIPMKGQINSLNASNAAAILMYEIVKQRL